MDSGNVSAIISACAGIGGVLLGNSFVAIKEAMLSRFNKKNDASYLAILVASHLDKFVEQCIHVAYDDGATESGDPAGGQFWEPTVETPTFKPLEIEANWKSLPRDLMFEILRIPDEQTRLDRHIRGKYDPDDLPDFYGFFYARRRGYAEFGIRVLKTAKRLHDYTGMPALLLRSGEMGKYDRLREILGRIEQERLEAIERVRSKGGNTHWLENLA